MQTDEKRQGVALAVKVNLTATKVILTAAVSLRIKWREDKVELACYNKFPFLLQRKNTTLTLLEHETLDKKKGAATIWGYRRKDNKGAFWERENTLKTHFPWRFSPKLKEKCQESKLYLGFLHLWSIFLHFWA